MPPVEIGILLSLEQKSVIHFFDHMLYLTYHHLFYHWFCYWTSFFRNIHAHIPIHAHVELLETISHVDISFAIGLRVRTIRSLLFKKFIHHIIDLDIVKDTQVFICHLFPFSLVHVAQFTYWNQYNFVILLLHYCITLFMYVYLI